MNDSIPTRELLAQQAEWLQRLARRLVADEDSALDLAQDTLAIAFERPPRTSERLRGWLARVMRNRMAERGRAAANRTARERALDAPQRSPGTDELVERIQLQRRIADHLLALPEETRTALVLRYYEDLPPRVIAARQGVPIATVKSRLARGLQALRSKLDDDHGGERAAWAVVLLPWIHPAPPVASATIAGGLLMNTKLIVGAAIVAAGALFFTRGGDTEPARDSVSQSAAASRTAADPEGATSAEARPPELSPDSRQVASGARAPVTPPAERPAVALRGLVLDASGAPLGNLRVRIAGTDQVAVSDVDGTFELETTLQEGRLEVADANWIAVRTALWRASGSIEPVLVAAPAIGVSGVVSDEWGRRLAGVRLTLDPPADLETRFEERLDASIREEWTTRADADGVFEFERIPALPGASLRAVLGGYEPAVLPAPQESTVSLWIELRRPRLETGTALEGRVLRADGSPATDALVTLGAALTTTDERGFFALELSRTGSAERLVAVEAGALPAVAVRPGPPDGAGSGWPAFVELTLGGETLAIEGRVVGADGSPRAGGRVWLGDAERFATMGAVPLQVEALLAGGTIPNEALDSMAALAAGAAEGSSGSARPALEPDAILGWVTTDADGRFRLYGLQDRDYILNVADSDLHWGLQTDPIRAGATGVVIEVPDGTTFARLRGTLVSEQGDPVPDVVITPWITAFQAVVAFPGGNTDVLRFFLGSSARSDANGRFELADVPRAQLQFHLVSDDIVPSYFAIEDVEDPDDFTLVVKARAHFEVVLDTLRATSLRVVDPEDRPLTLLQIRADGYSNFASLPIVEGRSGIVTVTTDADALLLFEQDEEVARIPLRLRPGDVVTLAR